MAWCIINIGYTYGWYLVKHRGNFTVSFVGPDVWPLEYPECSGARQSPINLESDGMYRLVVPEKLHWHGYWARPHNLTLTNNGHTSKLFFCEEKLGITVIRLG
jgi:carbonic anhydrase